MRGSARYRVMMSTFGSSSSSGEGWRPRSSRAFSPARSSARVQFDRRQLGALPLDRIEQRAPQRFGFHSSFDEVVLRTGGHRGYPEVLVVQPGQHHNRDGGIALADALEGVDTVGVGQIQIQQHAIGTVACQLPLGIRNRSRPSEIDIDSGVGDQLFYQQRVGSIVLHQEHRQARDLRRTGDGGGVLRVMRRAHRSSRPSRNVTPVALTPSSVTTSPTIPSPLEGHIRGNIGHSHCRNDCSPALLDRIAAEIPRSQAVPD